MAKRIAAITTVRNDSLFLPRWIAYYGQVLGFKNLFIILDGHDQSRPECPGAERVNFLSLPHLLLPRGAADRRRARVMSDLARGLFWYFDIVIATDVDEFLVADPATGQDLATYLSGISARTSVSGLGMDVGQHLRQEAPLDPSRPFIGQRQFAHLSARYTKPNTIFRPVTWGSGIHRIKGHGFRIDPNLYLFHFGMVDYAAATGKTQDPDRLKAGWAGHLERREALFRIITESTPGDTEQTLRWARLRQTLVRHPFAWNKPALMPGDPVVRIPDRFHGLV